MISSRTIAISFAIVNLIFALAGLAGWAFGPFGAVVVFMLLTNFMVFAIPAYHQAKIDMENKR